MVFMMQFWLINISRCIKKDECIKKDGCTKKDGCIKKYEWTPNVKRLDANVAKLKGTTSVSRAKNPRMHLQRPLNIQKLLSTQLESRDSYFEYRLHQSSGNKKYTYKILKAAYGSSWIINLIMFFAKKWEIIAFKK